VAATVAAAGFATGAATLASTAAARLASRDARVLASLAAASSASRAVTSPASLPSRSTRAAPANEASQIPHAPGVDTKGRTQHAPLDGRATHRDVGGYSNLQWPVWPILFQHECCGNASVRRARGDVYVLLRNRHPALP